MSNCVLGDIIYPNYGASFITDKYPYQIPVEVATTTPLTSFIVQISLSPKFITSDGYISFEGIFNIPIINVYLPGTYYFRISCDGINWSPVATFNVTTVPAIDISPINNISVESNSENTGFNIYLPQFLYGAPILGGSISSLHYSPGLEINISTDSTFNRNVYRFYNYSTKGIGLYKTSCIVPSFSSSGTYFFRVRTLLPTSLSEGVNALVWGPYTAFQVSWTNGYQNPFI
jgi:hypothetical protein